MTKGGAGGNNVDRTIAMQSYLCRTSNAAVTTPARAETKGCASALKSAKHLLRRTDTAMRRTVHFFRLQ